MEHRSIVNRKRTLWKAGLLAAALSLVGFTIAVAASGGLDTTFSGDGRQVTDFAKKWDETSFAMTLQSDGKIVAVGERWDPANSDTPATNNFAVARYNTNGTLDATFSGDGKQLTDFGGTDDADDVAIQSDGKIVVMGETCSSLGCNVAVARYNLNGTLDTTFSGDGKQILAGKAATNGGLAIQSDGKIVVAGYIVNASGDNDFIVYRLKSNGSADSTFSGDGHIRFGFGAGRFDVPYHLILQGSKIVVGGYTSDSSHSHFNMALARLTSAGALDTTFSGDGKLTTDFGSDEIVDGMALQPDGKIVVAGYKAIGTNYSWALARYNTNGGLDSTFSGDGRQTIAFGGGGRAWDVLVQGNGKIVVAGAGFNGSNRDFALARLNPNGTLDSTFNSDGKVLVNFGGHDDSAEGAARQTDGKYVLAGWTYDGVQYDFALARLLP